MSTTCIKIGVGGPVGSGKTALLDTLCKRLRERYNIAVITNDIYTREDAEFLIRSQALPPERIMGVETGGCPHTAIREDASINIAAVESMLGRSGSFSFRTWDCATGGKQVQGFVPRGALLARHAL